MLVLKTKECFSRKVWNVDKSFFAAWGETPYLKGNKQWGDLNKISTCEKCFEIKRKGSNSPEKLITH